MPENQRPAASASMPFRANPGRTDRAETLHECLLRESLARVGETCGSLCGPTAPFVVSVIDTTYHTEKVVVRGAEELDIEAPLRSFDEPELIAFWVLEDRQAEVAQRLNWPDVPRRDSRTPAHFARRVAHAVAEANRMEFVSVSPARFGGHLVKLRHSLSGPEPLPPEIKLTILVEGPGRVGRRGPLERRGRVKLPPLVLASPPPRRPRPSDAEVEERFLQRGERSLAESGRKPIRRHIFAQCRAEMGATYVQMSRVWLSAALAHLRRTCSERG